MTLSEVSKLRKEKPREFDALVAEKVMGWKLERKTPSGVHWWCDGEETHTTGDSRIVGISFRPSDSADSDYRVLYHIREKWDENQQWKFIDALRELLRIRDTDYSTMGTLHLILFGNGDAPGLRVGDYAAAALAVVMGRELA